MPTKLVMTECHHMSILDSININDIYNIQLTILTLKKKYNQDPLNQFVTKIRDKSLSLNMSQKNDQLENFIYLCQENMKERICIKINIFDIRINKIEPSINSQQ